MLDDEGYYDIEILKLDEKFLTDDRSSQKIQQMRLSRQAYC